MILSAAELTQTGAGSPGLTTDSQNAFSINLNLFAPGWTTPTITFPLVQGSAFITGKYNSAKPLIQTGVGFDSVTYAGAVIEGLTYKYRVRLQNGYTWLMYVSPGSTGYAENTFTLADGAIQGATGFTGTIQVAKLPGDGNGDAEAVYDSAAGAYPITGAISGAVDGTAGSYTMSWTKEGTASQSLLLFALPHHVESLSGETAGRSTDLQLMTTVKGLATAIRGESWTLAENDLPIDMAFAPWTPAQGSVKTVSSGAAQAIYDVGLAELQQNMEQQTNVGSLYFDGKALAKFANIVYTVYDIAGNRTLALSGLQVLQKALAFHINNEMPFPLEYESAWGGVVSSGAYRTGNALEDFGNTYYNDHHFHYGYFVYTAAVIGYLDSEWLDDGNVAWINMLVRDYANSVTDDQYFPFSRSFDWYHGHSWAAGLFESADGKNQESSSEDNMASYALKMWGQVINDKAMEARGNLMLAIQKRSFSKYYLFEDSNTVQPPEFIGNKVAGILFENKMDHTTYFGANPEYIQGIHMIPIMPFSAYIRSTTFVREEWNAYFANTINTIQGGWRGILEANFAIVNPSAAFTFFSDPNLNTNFLDGGASQTWYLAWTSALGGSGS
jgi:endo-1,3(4)-beta-glucanase